MSSKSVTPSAGASTLLVAIATVEDGASAVSALTVSGCSLTWNEGVNTGTPSGGSSVVGTHIWWAWAASGCSTAVTLGGDTNIYGIFSVFGWSGSQNGIGNKCNTGGGSSSTETLQCTVTAAQTGSAVVSGLSVNNASTLAAMTGNTLAASYTNGSSLAKMVYTVNAATTSGSGSTTGTSAHTTADHSWGIAAIEVIPSANVSANLTTVSATGAVGNVTSSGAAARTLTQLAATGAVGNVTSSGAAARTLGSVTATGAVGTVSSSGAAVRTLGTVSATGGLGNVSAGGAAARTLTTVSATGAVGSMTSAGNNAVATLTKVAATGAVGALSSSGAGVATLVGVAASGALGGAFSALGGAVATLTAVAATGWVGVVHAVSYKPPYPLQLELARPAFKLGTPPALLEVELVLPSLRLWLK